MPYVGFEQVAADNTVKDKDDLTIPATATHAELQADTAGVRYTMDNSTNPSTTSGMVLPSGGEPKQFSIDDIRRIKFIRDGGSNANLNLHYFGTSV